MDKSDDPTSTTMSNTIQPKPTDLDMFLPWACKEYCIDAEILVTRIAQKTYTSAAIAKKKSPIKLRKKPSVLPAVIDSEHDIRSSVLEHAMSGHENEIVIETFYNSNENLVQLKLLKNKVLPRKFMQIIALTLPYHEHLTSITINSGLRMDSLYEISKFLPNSSITELCLDNTYIREANYHTLLSHNKLKHLSLAKCKINDAVVKTIADQLKDPRPASRILSALNLSSNSITDVGAKYIADMLRTNRQLSYLNLAGNMITDEGGMSILDTLHEFLVHTQELLESRARYVAYLKKRKDLIDTHIKDLQTVKFDKSPKKKTAKRGKLESQSLQELPSQKPQIDSDDGTIQKRAEFFADRTMGLFDEPFSPNKTTSHDGVVYCVGNYTLCYLNVAYNNLTYASLKKLHEVLLYQRSHNITPRGLIKVVIEGNLMPVACNEYEEIDHLLMSDVRGSRKYSETKRKHLTSRSSGNVTIR